MEYCQAYLFTPGAAAVNTMKYPLGTIFRDHDTDEVFLATDRHGEKGSATVFKR